MKVQSDSHIPVKSIKDLISVPLSWIWGAVALMVLVSGIRFSDGHMLLAIARGAKVDDPVFANPATQYVWDSPLKTSLLHAIPPSVSMVAGVFAVLAFLPLLLLLRERTRLIGVGALVLFPTFKISIQNIGVGDGLVILLTSLACTRARWFSIAICIFFIGLWHPQQSFFISVSVLVAKYCYNKLEWRDCLGVLCGLAAAFFVYIAYRHSLNFTYSGRGRYMIEQLVSFLPRNLLFAPIAFASIGLAFVILQLRPRAGHGILIAWILVILLIALLTTDVTRVASLLCLPILLTGIHHRVEALPRSRVLLLVILVIIIPPYSWSGLDFSTWPDLVRDIHKWVH